MEELKKLGYEYNELEPIMDTETISIHHGKHHQTYVDKYNGIVKGTSLEEKPVEEVLKNLEEVPEDIRQAVINNGGGVWNHNFFWSVLKKDVNIPEELKEIITKNFGSFDKFKEDFKNASLTQFGSGWAWLVKDGEELKIIKTSNQDSPISKGLKPLLVIDVWEHAYYLKYQNRRLEYVDNFWNIINWDEVLRLIKE